MATSTPMMIPYVPYYKELSFYLFKTYGLETGAFVAELNSNYASMLKLHCNHDIASWDAEAMVWSKYTGQPVTAYHPIYNPNPRPVVAPPQPQLPQGFYNGNQYPQSMASSAQPMGYGGQGYQPQPQMAPGHVVGYGAQAQGYQGGFANSQPTGYGGQAPSYQPPAANVPQGYSQQPYQPPAVNVPQGYSQQPYQPPAVNVPQGYSQQPHQSPAANVPQGYSQQPYQPPAVNVPQGYSQQPYNPLSQSEYQNTEASMSSSAVENEGVRVSSTARGRRKRASKRSKKMKKKFEYHDARAPTPTQSYFDWSPIATIEEAPVDETSPIQAAGDWYTKGLAPADYWSVQSPQKKDKGQLPTVEGEHHLRSVLDAEISGEDQRLKSRNCQAKKVKKHTVVEKKVTLEEELDGHDEETKPEIIAKFKLYPGLWVHSPAQFDRSFRAIFASRQAESAAGALIVLAKLHVEFLDERKVGGEQRRVLRNKFNASHNVQTKISVAAQLAWDAKVKAHMDILRKSELAELETELTAKAVAQDGVDRLPLVLGTVTTQMENLVV